MPGADFPDWTDGVTVVDYTIPAGADFPDWTKVAAQVLTNGASAGLVPNASWGSSQSGNFPTNHITNVYNSNPFLAGDKIVAVCAASSAVTWTNNQGMSSIVGPVVRNGNSMQVFYKVATGSEGLTWTFTATASCIPALVAFAFRGSAGLDGLPAVAGSTGASAVAPASNVSVTTDISVVTFCSWHPGNTGSLPGGYFSTPTGYTVLVREDFGGPANSAEIATFYQVLSGTGTSGPVSSVPFVTPDDGMDCQVLIGPA